MSLFKTFGGPRRPADAPGRSTDVQDRAAEVAQQLGAGELACAVNDPIYPFWEHPCTFAIDTIAHWQIGALGLWIARRAQEWRLVTETEGDPADSRRTHHYPAIELPSADALVQRFAGTRLSHTIHLGARLADRRFVVRPESPFELLPDEAVDLFIGSPLWITVRDANHARPLAEAPVLRPSDTWVGPDPTLGVLAYAGRTMAAMSLDAAPRRPGRVVTRLTLINRSARPFALHRVVLPMPQLGLWVAEDNRLFTDAVTFVINDDGVGEVGIDNTRFDHYRRLAEPREPTPRGIRYALSLLFG